MFGALAILLSPFIVLGGMFLLSLAGACITEVQKRIVCVRGLDFEISETDCDTLAKDASISVFVNKSGRTKKSLLFKYSPGGDALIPEIEVLDRIIQISIPRVSSIIVQRENWEDLTVNYTVGAIDYPVINK